MWRCGTEWTRAASWWGSTVGKSPRLPSSRLETNSSSSSCQTTRHTGQASPSDTRSSRPVSGLPSDSVSSPLKFSQLGVPFMHVYFSISQSVNQLLLTLTLYEAINHCQGRIPEKTSWSLESEHEGEATRKKSPVGGNSLEGGTQDLDQCFSTGGVSEPTSLFH